MAEDNHRRKQYGPFWKQFCETSYSRLMAGASKLANGKHDAAEDLVQDTICQALSYCKNPAEVKSPLAYLSTVMRHIWIDKWNKEKSISVESLDALIECGKHPTVEPDALRLLEHDERTIRYRGSHGSLTSREKRLLTLHLQGYKCRDIADELNEDVRLTRYDLNAVKAKVRYRLRSRQTRAATSVKA